MFRRLVRITVPIAAFGVGAVSASKISHIRTLPAPRHANEDALAKVTSSSQYQQCINDPQQKLHFSSQLIPKGHRHSFVPTGLLSGAKLFGIDPVIFTNKRDKTLTGFYHVGSEMVSHDGQVHNGAILTILDGELCKCGFPELPSKRGVTAALDLKFHAQAEPDSIVMLTAKVTESKGRKVVIEGSLKALPHYEENKVTHWREPVEIATAKCLLVEPRWFKYVAWMWLNA